MAENGERGERVELVLELKLLADVGLVGPPNAGKSTLLAWCSKARPKIAPYPFTTTEPVLGVVGASDQIFVMMEVPGLIEGAHKGVGLGHEFLRHAERARLLLHLLDGSSEDPLHDWRSINQELSSFDASLGAKPHFIVVNKLDITEVRERVPALKIELETLGVPVFFVSAATGEGVDILLNKTLEALSRMLKPEPVAPPAKLPIHSPRMDEAFRVVREDGVLVVHAAKLERLVPRADLRDSRVMIQLWREMERIGVVKALEDQGIQAGDTVRLGGVELEWY